MKKIAFAFPLAVMALGLGADELKFSGDASVPAAYGDSRCRLLALTPEARQMLKTMSTIGAEYRPLAGRTRLLVRTQLKYGLQRTDFLHNWYERPIHQDTTYASANRKGKYLNERSWRKQVEIGRLSKLDGFAFFPSTKGRNEAIAASRLPGAEFTLMPEMTGNSFGKDGGLSFCRQAAAMPNAFRVGDRAVLTHYPVVADDKLGRFETLRENLAKSDLSGQVAIVPYSYVFARSVPDEGYLAEKTDVAMLEKARNHIREVLRRTDGFVFNLGEANCDRRTCPEFVDSVICPLVHSVLVEPEFAGKKLFGVVFSQAHENDYRWTGNFDSTGTRSLRDNLASIVRLRPDFAVGTEWDEEDENTHFRPTVSNGHVTQRLLRYYSDLINGRKFEPMPNDDASIPNLVVSYRKSLQAGELLETEIVNIPDGTATAKAILVTLRWKTPLGKIVKTYAPARLGTESCEAVWFKTPVSELVSEQVLVPELTVECAGRRQVFADGFWPVNLEANRNWDYKWIREALREKSQGVSGSLSVGERRSDGTVEVSGKISGASPFRSVEVLEGPDTVYMAGAPAAGKDEICVRISMQGHNSTAELNQLKGTIVVLNARNLRCSPISQGKLVQRGNGWLFRGMPFPNRFTLSGPAERTFYAVFSEASADTAEIDIDLPPVFKRRIKVSELLAREGLGTAGPYGAYLWVERFYRPISQPQPLGTNAVDFSFLMRPKDANGILRLQAVDENFRSWRGATHAFNRPAGREVRFHVCEKATGDRTELALDASRLVRLKYDFNRADGDVLWSGENRLLPLALGASVLPITGIGCADGGGQMSPFRGMKLSADDRITAPILAIEPEGFPALAFNGSSYAGTGLQAIPQHAGFELTLKLKPDDVEGVQALVGTGNLGFELLLDRGVPRLNLSRGMLQRNYRRNEAAVTTFTAPKLVAKKWQVVKFFFDQQSAYLETDGVRGNVEHFCDYQSKPCAAGIGRLGASGLDDRCSVKPYRGRIAEFSIEPR